jgi:O-antigen/teichoic acid export membrane protein
MMFDGLRRWRSGSTASQIVGGSAISIGVRIAGVGLSYAANILISRLLGLAGYGQYAIALGWALVLVLPARLGFDYSALRYATGYVEAGDSGSLRGFVRVSLGSVIGLSLLVGAVMVLVASGTTNAVSLPTIAAAAALIAPIAVIGILSVMMRLSQRYLASQFYDQVMRPALLVVLLGLVSLVDIRWSAPLAMLLTAVAAWLSLGALGLHFRKAFATIWSVQPRFAEWRHWFRLSLPLLGVSVAQELLNQLEVILLGAFADARAAGLFAAAARLVSLMTFALAAFGIVSGPMIASAYRRGDLAELQSITSFTTRLGLIFAAGVALALIVGGKLLLSLFGPEFEAAYLPLLILVAGGLVNACTGVVVYLATLTGRERPALAIFLSALILSLVLNLLLIPRLGVVGAAIASSSALAFWNIAMLLYVRRALGIDASAFGSMPRSVR